MSIKDTWKHLKVVYNVRRFRRNEWKCISIWRHWLKLASCLQPRTLDMKAGMGCIQYETTRLHVARSYRIKAQVYDKLHTPEKSWLEDGNFDQWQLECHRRVTDHMIRSMEDRVGSFILTECDSYECWKEADRGSLTFRRLQIEYLRRQSSSIGL